MALTNEDLQKIRSLVQTMLTESERKILESVRSQGGTTINQMIAHIGDLKQQLKT